MVYAINRNYFTFRTPEEVSRQIKHNSKNIWNNNELNVWLKELSFLNIKRNWWKFQNNKKIRPDPISWTSAALIISLLTSFSYTDFNPTTWNMSVPCVREVYIHRKVYTIILNTRK